MATIAITNYILHSLLVQKHLSTNHSKLPVSESVLNRSEGCGECPGRSERLRRDLVNRLLNWGVVSYVSCKAIVYP